MITGGQLIAELRPVGTLDASVTNEIRATSAAPLGAAGFNPPSLLSLFAFPQTFFHNGSADTLDTAMQNVAHRSAGTETDRLQNASQRAQLIKFLLSIDATTAPISPAALSALRNVSAASGGGTVAPDSYVTALGSALATQIQSAPSVAYPVVLAGSTVSIKDSAVRQQSSNDYSDFGERCDCQRYGADRTGGACALRHQRGRCRSSHGRSSESG